MFGIVWDMLDQIEVKQTKCHAIYMYVNKYMLQFYHKNILQIFFTCFCGWLLSKIHLPERTCLWIRKH